jgi:hypothetical protein
MRRVLVAVVTLAIGGAVPSSAAGFPQLSRRTKSLPVRGQLSRWGPSGGLLGTCGTRCTSGPFAGVRGASFMRRSPSRMPSQGNGSRSGPSLGTPGGGVQVAGEGEST